MGKEPGLSPWGLGGGGGVRVSWVPGRWGGGRYGVENRVQGPWGGGHTAETLGVWREGGQG